MVSFLYFIKWMHVYACKECTLWSPLKIWIPKIFEIANFEHPVSKSWLRPCLRTFFHIPIYWVLLNTLRMFFHVPIHGVLLNTWEATFFALVFLFVRMNTHVNGQVTFPDKRFLAALPRTLKVPQICMLGKNVVSQHEIMQEAFPTPVRTLKIPDFLMR